MKVREWVRQHTPTPKASRCAREGHRLPVIRRGDSPYPPDRWRPRMVRLPESARPFALRVRFFCKCHDCGRWVNAKRATRAPLRLDARRAAP